jgi:predicted aspartyl protease
VISQIYDFTVPIQRGCFGDYLITLSEVTANPKQPVAYIQFVFDTGANYTMLNKSFAEAQNYKIFYKGVPFGSYEKTGKIMLCDLRRIPKIVFGNKQIIDLVIATPQDDKCVVTQLLGRNFIDVFSYGVNLDDSVICFRQRDIPLNPDYSCRNILPC